MESSSISYSDGFTASVAFKMALGDMLLATMQLLLFGKGVYLLEFDFRNICLSPNCKHDRERPVGASRQAKSVADKCHIGIGFLSKAHSQQDVDSET